MIGANRIKQPLHVLHACQSQSTGQVWGPGNNLMGTQLGFACKGPRNIPKYSTVVSGLKNAGTQVLLCEP